METGTAHLAPAAEVGTVLGDPHTDPGYWHSLIGEAEAGDFLGLTARTMQAHRQRGNGSRYISLSKRCIRYRRADLKAWADTRIRTSTSDPGITA